MIRLFFFFVFLASAQDGSRWWRHVEFLADDKLEGRNTGSEGHRKAANYVAEQFERAGLKPAGVEGYIQPVKFKTRQIDESRSSVALVRNGKAEPLTLGEDVTIGLRTDPAATVDAPLVFAGYGLSVPEEKYDDFTGLDVRGKIIVYLSGGPPSIPGALSSHYQSAGERSANLTRLGVVGTCVIQNPKTMDIPWARSTLARLAPAMSLADASLNESGGQKIGLGINPAHADKFLNGSGHTFNEILELANAGRPLPHFVIPASLKATVAVKRGEVESQNVAAIYPGADPQLRNQYVVMSAHLDHIGVGEPIHGDRIYNGAMDNASGVAAMLDIAEMLHDTHAHPRRSILFVAVTGEEKGLLGSRFFANHPTVDPKSIVADINSDMFLPLFPLDVLTVYGLDESDLGDDVREVAKQMGIRVQGDPEPLRNVFIRSDQYSFIKQGVPSLSLKVGYEKGSPQEQIAKTWLKERYHAPSDDLQQPIDKRAAGKFDALAGKLLERIADQPARPQWKANSFFKRYAMR
ncbi:MAG: M28 family metallopeptidase [Acidobacteriota bacterium]|nr:M28 family metallopeptidase [Acidobacteriota bacterium]